MPALDLSVTQWRKSSRSSDVANCVAVTGVGGAVYGSKVDLRAKLATPVNDQGQAPLSAPGRSPDRSYSLPSYAGRVRKTGGEHEMGIRPLKESFIRHCASREIRD